MKKMERHLAIIRTASLELDTSLVLDRRPARHAQAHAKLIQVLCEAMAAQIPAADAAAAANMSLGELFNTLRKHG